MSDVKVAMMFTVYMAFTLALVMLFDKMGLDGFKSWIATVVAEFLILFVVITVIIATSSSKSSW